MLLFAHTPGANCAHRRCSEPVDRLRRVRVRAWIIWGVVGFVGLILALLLIVTQLLDPNVFRGQIEAAVRSATGRPFEIRGDLDIGWYPWLALRIGPAHLGNAPGTEGPPLIQWQSASVGAKLIPLLRGELIVDRVRLDHPRINLRRGSDGSASWDDLLAGSSDQAGGGRRLQQLGGLELRSGELEYIDERSGTRIQIRDWQLDVSEWAPGEEVTLSTELTLVPANEHRAEIRFRTRAQLATDARQLDLRDVDLIGAIHGGGIQQDGLNVMLRAPSVNAQFSPLTISIPGMSARLGDSQIAASLHATEAASSVAMQANGAVSIQVPSLRKLLTAAGVEMSLPRDERAFGPLAFRSEWAYVDGAMTVKPIEMQIDDTRLTGEASRSNQNPAVWQFQLRGDRIDLARYVPADDPDADPFELPVETLRALPVRGELIFDQANFAKTSMKNVRLRIEHESP
jgi:AsmA protein